MLRRFVRRTTFFVACCARVLQRIFCFVLSICTHSNDWWIKYFCTKKKNNVKFHRKANCQKTVKKEQFNPFQVSSATKFICSPLCVIRNAATFQLSMAQLIWSSARVLISKRTWLSMAIECRFRLKESSFIPWKKKQVFGWASERSNALLHRNHLSLDTRAYSNEKLDPSGKWQREFYSRITLWSTPKKPFISNQISKDSMVTSLDSHVKWN